MRKVIFTILLLLSAGLLSAEVITLKTGKVIKGDVLFENDDVVVIRDASGARFQYPKSDVQSRVATVPTENAKEEVVVEEQVSSQPGKRLALALEISDGVPVIPGRCVGENMVGVDLLICSHHIGEKRVMVGASVGYRATKLDKDGLYSFMPLAAVVRYPVMEGKHSPMIGASLGYGVALSKLYLGGIYAGVDVAYRYEISQKSALFVGLNLQCQQAKMSVEEKMGEGVFADTKGQVLLTPSVKFGVAF